jgi:hypothetical protein
VASSVPLAVWGMGLYGDIGGITLYTDRFGRHVSYPVAPPKEPPSPLQIAHRNRFRLAVTNWKALDQATRADWEALSKAAWLMMTGHNLWVLLSLNPDPAALNTLCRQTGINVEHPPDVPRNPPT